MSGAVNTINASLKMFDVSLGKEIIKIKDLKDGKYMMSDYEHKNNKFGSSYIISCVDENDNVYRCWSNSYIYKYLHEKKPRKKFIFTVKDGLINIPGYAQKVILT